MSAIRCVKACRVVVTKDGEETEQLIPFGKWLMVEYLEEIDDEYINVYLKDGSAIAGIQRKLFEIGHARVVEAEPLIVDLISLEEEDEDDEQDRYFIDRSGAE